jgi:hypothetical protein
MLIVKLNKKDHRPRGVRSYPNTFWHVLLTRKRVRWSNHPGPWYLVEQCTQIMGPVPTTMWVHATMDKDYEVKELKEV